MRYFILFLAAAGWSSGVSTAVVLAEKSRTWPIYGQWIATGICILIFMGAIGWTKDYMKTEKSDKA